MPSQLLRTQTTRQADAVAVSQARHSSRFCVQSQLPAGARALMQCPQQYACQCWSRAAQHCSTTCAEGCIVLSDTSGPGGTAGLMTDTLLQG